MVYNALAFQNFGIEVHRRLG